jgi:hypothetical protein
MFVCTDIPTVGVKCCMAVTKSIPTDWRLVDERTVYDTTNQAHTSVLYAHDERNQRVRINRVQEPNKFGGWGFLVWTVGEHSDELGIVEDLDGAKELAREFMRTFDATPMPQGQCSPQRSSAR